MSKSAKGKKVALEEKGNYILYNTKHGSGKTIAKPAIKHEKNAARSAAINLHYLLVNPTKVTVAQLKTALSTFGETQKGNKYELVERVLPHVNNYFEPKKRLDPEEVLSKLNPKVIEKKKPTKGWVAIDTHTKTYAIGLFKTKNDAIEEYVHYLFENRRKLVREIKEIFEKEFDEKFDRVSMIEYLSQEGDQNDFLQDELTPVIEEVEIGEIYHFYDLGFENMRNLYDLLNIINKGKFGAL
jgi:hypothetical protein